MKFNKYLLGLYKNSPDGKAVISKFADRKEWIDEVRLFERYNLKIRKSFNIEILCEILEDLWCYKVSEYEGLEIKSLEDAENLYVEVISTGLYMENEELLRLGRFEES